jgi:hypothetical protein
MSKLPSKVEMDKAVDAGFEAMMDEYGDDTIQLFYKIFCNGAEWSAGYMSLLAEKDKEEAPNASTR